MTTGEAIRNFCKECVNSVQTKVIKDCGGEYVRVTKKPCALFKYRLRGKGTLKAIRRNCVECVGGTYWVEDCTTETCPLHPFRMGKHPSGLNWVRVDAGFSKKAGIGRELEG